MPNNNPTLLTISGTSEDCQQFINDVTSDKKDLDFEKISQFLMARIGMDGVTPIGVPSGELMTLKSGPK